MTATDIDVQPTRDPEFLAPVLNALGRFVRTYFRAEVRGMERVPAGGALVVSNHSGGTLACDVPVFASEFARVFGVERDFVGRPPLRHPRA